MDLVFVSIQPVCVFWLAFNTFAFKVIIDIYVLIAIFLIVRFDFVDLSLLLYFLTIKSL